jgi:type VI secretion system secreted protein Hcp
MDGADYFLKLDGIPGESSDADHKEEIEILSWSWGETQAVIHSGRGGSAAGKVAMRDFQFATNTNKASPVLILACASGQRIPKARLTCRKKGEVKQEFLVVTLSDVLVSSYQTAGPEQGLPLDEVSLNYRKIEMEYRQQLPNGSLGPPIKVGWDVAANKRI